MTFILDNATAGRLCGMPPKSGSNVVEHPAYAKRAALRAALDDATTDFVDSVRARARVDAAILDVTAEIKDIKGMAESAVGFARICAPAYERAENARFYTDRNGVGRYGKYDPERVWQCAIDGLDLNADASRLAYAYADMAWANVSAA